MTTKTLDARELQKEFILKENLWKVMINLSWPAIIAMVLYGANTMLDAFFVGRYVGEVAFAGVSLAYPISSISTGLGTLVGVGAGSVLSIALGAKDIDTQKRLIGNVNALTVICTVIYMIIALLFSTQLIGLMGGRGEELILGDEYFRVTVIGAVFWIYGLAINMIIRAEGRMKTAAWMMATGLIANAVFNYIFIVVMEMGVKGAAWGIVTLSALPKHLGTLLNADMWEKDVPIILTSGTMSVDGDFSHLKRKAGLHVNDGKISETRTKSPFDYRLSALLYLPPNMPYPDVKDEEYNKTLLVEILELIHLTHGHTLLLFTSYRQMEQVFLEVQKQITKYPLFLMGKGKIKTIEEFRHSKNGVLFASDSAGEGIDLAGDILSSVIIVRLPFPIPDAMSEYELSLCEDFGDFLKDSVIPTMLMKLRQWFGRGIRRETDSCVFSILDSRASRRYKNDILTALPDMPITRNIQDVGRFILNKKEDSYFE